MRVCVELGLTLVALTAGWSLAADSPRSTPAKSGTAGREPAAVATDIDRIIDAKLAEAKLPASPLADDAEFIRRLSLDIRGRIPYADRVAAFLADTDPNKRSKLIDEFLADSEYGEHFGIMWYHRIVKPDDENRFVISHKLQDWLADSFNKNRGWNAIVSDILTASGERDSNPQTVFWLANVGDAKKGQPEPNKVTAAASRLFLGMKLECCECHNHPFTRLKQEDFWGVAAFFAQTHADHSTKQGAKTGAMPSVHEGGAVKAGKKKDAAEHAPFGEITIPDTKGKTVKATFLGADKPAPLSGKELRPLFAAWATSAGNPYFAKAAANRMWANFFGRGIVDPVDDMRPEAKSSHPELLKLLADEFVASGFDLKYLIRCICASKTYQRASRPLPENKDDDRLYSRMPVKVMSADVLFDSLAVALGHAAASKEKDGAKKKKKAGGDVREQFRKFFHAEADDDVGAIEDYSHGIPQALRLMNAQQINDTAGTVSRLTKAGGGTDKVIEGLFLTALSRKPTEIELTRMKKYVADEKEPAKAYGDILWVLLNSSEFLLNH
jgi:Protein of unknown function (DUF1549)/Protein of unknown function (DUF1553)